jgi:hypothetical protein
MPWRRGLLALALLTTLTAGRCSPSGSGGPDLRHPALPEPAPDLASPCRDPGLSGDKGRDAIRHRQALADCEARRRGWSAFYRDVQQAHGGAP